HAFISGAWWKHYEIHRGANEHLSRHRQPRGAALHPAPRRAGRLLARPRRQDHRLRRFCWQPAIHHQGNLADNPKAQLFLIDYAQRKRVKIWGEARVVEGDAELIAKLMPEGYKARPEQVILFTVSAWDENCPQHIPQRFEAVDVAAALAERDRRIETLQAEIKLLRENTARGSHGPSQPRRTTDLTSPSSPNSSPDAPPCARPGPAP